MFWSVTNTIEIDEYTGRAGTQADWVWQVKPCLCVFTAATMAVCAYGQTLARYLNEDEANDIYL